MNKTGLITRDYVNTVIRKREKDIHKGICGKVLIIAGSYGMAGAAILCGKGALRSGSGLVKIAAPEKIIPIIQIGIPEATCIIRDASNIEVGEFDAIALGPGLGDDNSDREILISILKNYDKTLVLDADGLNMVSKYGLYKYLLSSKCKVIITPHPGEAKRLLRGGGIEDDGLSRLEMARMLVEKTRTTTVLKGSDTIVAWDKAQSYTNTTGNPGMATGGSGDVLTGIIASLAGQKLSPQDAAMVGVFLHGMAGDIMSHKYGEYGLIAGDIAEGVALALKEVVN